MTVIYFRRLGENASPRYAEYLRQSQDATQEGWSRRVFHPPDINSSAHFEYL